MTRVRDRPIDRDAFAAGDGRYLREEIAITRRLPSLDPRLDPMLERVVLALRDVSGECALEAALETFLPIVDVLAGWPAPLGAPTPRAVGARPARRSASWPDRRVVRMGMVVIALEALRHGAESRRGRHLARAAVELSRERACGHWRLPMALAAPPSISPGRGVA